jgi:hypothetical protein
VSQTRRSDELFSTEQWCADNVNRADRFDDDMHTSPSEPAGLHFRASLRGGELLLFVPQLAGARTARRDAVAHAATLASAERLLTLLERWLDQMIDPQPTLALRDQDAGKRSMIELRILPGGELAPRGAVLHMPLTLLQAASRPPEALLSTTAQATVAWPQWECQVVLDVIDAPRIAPTQVQAGSLLLLPRSFATGPNEWPVLVVADGLRHGLSSMWSATQRTLRLPAATPVQALAGVDDWWVISETRFSLAADVCQFGAALRAVSLPFDAAGAAHLVRGNVTLAVGRLVSAGQGYGLLVERLTGVDDQVQSSAAPPADDVALAQRSG